MSIESRIKMSQSLKGRSVWNKGVKGWNDGTKAGFKKGHPFYKGGEKGWFKSENMIGENNPLWKGGISKNEDYRRTNKCMDCGKPIYKLAKYCKHCVKKGERSPSWKGGIANIRKRSHCSDCGKPITTGFRFCLGCSRKGERSWNWKGGITPENQRRCLRDSWKKTIIEIYKRDNWTCQRCGKHGRLNCHHLIPYRISKDDSPQNLVTLCPKCHTTTEREFYKGGLKCLSLQKTSQVQVVTPA